MESLQSQKIAIYYPAGELTTAELLCQVVGKTDHLMFTLWGLQTPEDCRAYVLKDWQDFLSHAPPRNIRFFLKLLHPILSSRINRLWPYVGGWEQRFGKRIAVGVKPPDLLRQSDSSMGSLIFIPVEDITLKFQLTACHELAHAYSTHLALPAWLKEGIAMVSTDH